MKRVYLLTTALLCVWMGLGFLGLLFGVQEAVTTIARLGYPDYFRTILGIAKGVGALVLAVPWMPAWLKQWAYGGVVIELLSAFFSYNAAEMGFARSLPPLVFLVVVLTSFVTWQKLPTKV